MNKKLHVRKGDNVIVLSGKDKGKKGKVLSVMPKSGKVIVEGVAVATKHKKPRSQADVGGILHQETPIYACKVMHICDKCGQPTRIARKVLEDGSIARVCKKCNEIL
ncbi:MAG: 50S ribosomal protein L24 [Clostridia bacterium]|nr:50S ribosomal protein L24 [Clostridia bacterium]